MQEVGVLLHVVRLQGVVGVMQVLVGVVLQVVRLLMQG